MLTDVFDRERCGQCFLERMAVGERLSHVFHDVVRAEHDCVVVEKDVDCEVELN